MADAAGSERRDRCGAATRRRMRRLVATVGTGLTRLSLARLWCKLCFAYAAQGALPRHDLVERCEVCGSARKPLSERCSGLPVTDERQVGACCG